MNYPDYLPHHQLPALLSKAQHANPKQAIISFFDNFDFASARAHLCRLVKTAFSSQRLRRRALLNILGLKEELLLLLEAATLMKDEGGADIPNDESNLMNPRWYFYQARRNNNEWHYVPRYLSEKQYRQPYRVFKKCTAGSTLPQWKTHIDSLVYAAAYGNIDGSDGMIDCSEKEKSAYEQATRLIQLVEAAHLVYVREILPAGTKQSHAAPMGL